MIDFLEELGDMIFGNQRLDALKHFAEAKDFQIKRKANAQKLPIEVQKMEFFQGKRKKSIKGFLYKEDSKFDALNQIFDYYYSGDYGTTTTTLFLYGSEMLDLPTFSITPKGGFSKLGSIFSNTEWSVVNPDFDKAFKVESSDLNFMRMMITIQFADVLLGLQNFTVEGSGNYLAIYKKGAKVDIVDMDNVYDDGLELLDIILHDNSGEIV